MKKERTLAGVLAASMCATLLAGCGAVTPDDEPAPANEETTKAETTTAAQVIVETSAKMSASTKLS